MKTKKINNLQKFSIYIVLIVLFVACSIISPYFLQYSNLINVTRQLCVGILIAYGEMLLIISGFLDLSVGSVLALAGVYSVSVYKATNSILLARPYRVLLTRYQTTIVTSITRITGTGTGPTIPCPILTKFPN